MKEGEEVSNGTIKEVSDGTIEDDDDDDDDDDNNNNGKGKSPL